MPRRPCRAPHCPPLHDVEAGTRHPATMVKPTAMQIEEWADRFAFLSRNLAMQPALVP
jgi:hypothetical protein